MPRLTIDIVIALALLYVFLLSAKHIVRGHGATRTLGLVGAFLFVPSITIMRWFKMQDVVVSSVPEASPWWLLSIRSEGVETPVEIDLVTLALVFSILYFAGLPLVNILIAWNKRLQGGQFQDLHRGMILWLFVAAGLVVYCKLIGFSLTPFLFGMGAVSIVVGLAIQEPLSNFFAGLALDIEGFIRPGDWIRVDTEGGTIGQVVEKGWRTTRLLTIDLELVSLPNRVIGAQKILNYHLPDVYHAHRLKVSASYNDPPMKVKEILTMILLEHQKILASPKPQVLAMNFSDSAVEYEMEYYLDDFGCSENVRNDLLTRVWYDFRKHQIQTPYPTRTVHLQDAHQLKMEETNLSQKREQIVEFLQTLNQFSRYLSPEDFELLALDATEGIFAPEEMIIQEGTMGDAIYLVKSGWCEIVLPGGEKKRLQRGEYFGEMAMLMGQPRSADIRAGLEGARLVMIGRESLLRAFEKHPQMRTEFDQTCEARLEESAPLKPQVLETKQSIGQKMCKVIREHFVPW